MTKETTITDDDDDHDDDDGYNEEYLRRCLPVPSSQNGLALTWSDKGRDSLSILRTGRLIW